MEKKFINKNNLSYLNNNLVQKLNLRSKSKDEKKECIQILLNNMRSVYKKLDKSKITDNNLNKVMKSFYKYSVDLSYKELSNTKKSKSFSKPFSKKINSQYKRDYEINGNRSVKYMDRPNMNSSRVDNDYSSFDTTQRNNNYTQSINRNVSDYNLTNDLRNGINARSKESNKLSTNKTYEDLLKSRNTEVKNRNSRPTTPDFSLDGSGAKQKKNNLDNIENFQNIKITGNFQNENSFLSRETENINIQSNRMEGDTYHLVGSNLDSNFGSVQFGNNELSRNLPDIDESVNVSDRLKQLQSERSSFDTYITNNENQQNPIENKSNQYNKNIEEQKRAREQQEQMQKYQEQQEQQAQMQKYQEHQAQMQKYQEKQMQQKEHFGNNNENSSVYNIPNQQLYDLINNVYQKIPKESNKPTNTKKTNVSNNQNNKLNNFLGELSQKQFDQMKQIQQLQKQMQNQLQNFNIANSNLYESDDRIKNELISKIKILTGELEQYKRTNIELKKRLDDEINNKDIESNKKIKIIERKKEDIRNEIIRLSNKHKDIEESYHTLVTREKIIKKIIKINSDALSINRCTFLINSKKYNNMSKYIYKFKNKLENVKRIELISYDFPLISNNINDTNNKIYIKFEDTNKSVEVTNNSESEIKGSDEYEEINQITIPHGNYDISSLIKKINKLCRIYMLTFTYNKNTSKVTVKTEQETTFNLLNENDSVLYKMGFVNRSYEKKNKYVSNNAYDLRKNKYVKILFNNCKDKYFSEVGIQTSKSNIYYKDYIPPIDYLDHLDIEIQNNNGKPIDFCNLLHKMEFVITTGNINDINLQSFDIKKDLIDDEDEQIQIDSDDIKDQNNIRLIDDPDMLIHVLKGRLNEITAQ